MSVELPEPARLEDRTVVVTGASSGIGRAAARELALLGARVAVVGRNPDRTRAVAEEIGGTAYLVDFHRLESVRTLAESLLADLDRIDVLANNAGGMIPRSTTVDGFDAMFQQNHLSPFLLTSLLLPRLLETAAEDRAVRIVSTASVANRFGHVDVDDLDMLGGRYRSAFSRYGTTKLENILFTRELARRLVGTGVSAYAFHPGWIASSFGPTRNPMYAAVQNLFARSPEQGAQPLVRLAAATAIPAPPGNYFDRLRAPGGTSRQADDEGLAKALWQASVERAGL